MSWFAKPDPDVDFDDDLDISEDDVGTLPVNSLRAPTDDEREKWQLGRRWSLFMNPRMFGLCFNPWQFLKVDIFRQTNVCCTYFGRLPEFQFVSAKDFHGEDGMWNHPFMQHLRAKDGSEDEVPYCGFCQGRYRPDLPSRSARRLAIVESQKLLQDKMDEVVTFAYSGRLKDLDEDLSTFQFPLKRRDGWMWAPFKSKRQFYRRDVRMAGFQNIGPIAQLGAGPAAYAPFLAEPGNTLTLVDWQPKQIANVAELMAELELPVHTEVVAKSGLELPFEDESLSGVWLDAHRWLDQYPCPTVFAEIRRVLKPEGVLRVVRAPSSGSLIMQIAETTDQEEAEALIEVLRNEAKLSGPAVYFTVEKVYRTMKRLGFVVNKRRPPQIHVEGPAYREIPTLGRDLTVIADQLQDADFRAELANTPALQEGLETAISFNATRR